MESQLTLPTLLQIGVPAAIVPDRYKFAILILRDDYGSKTDVIMDANGHNPEKSCINILQKWLQGGGRPVSWTTLIYVLRDLRLNKISNDIEEYLHLSVI